jgi:hypothetical protein
MISSSPKKCDSPLKKLRKLFRPKFLFFFTDATDKQARVLTHRDKTRVQMPAKIFPHLKVKC